MPRSIVSITSNSHQCLHETNLSHSYPQSLYRQTRLNRHLSRTWALCEVISRKTERRSLRTSLRRAEPSLIDANLGRILIIHQMILTLLIATRRTYSVRVVETVFGMRRLTLWLTVMRKVLIINPNDSYQSQEIIYN